MWLISVLMCIFTISTVSYAYPSVNDSVSEINYLGNNGENQVPEVYTETGDVSTIEFLDWLATTISSVKIGDNLIPKEYATKQHIREVQGSLMNKYIDWSADPCDDFYQFACGKWEEHNPIPDDNAGFNTFEKLRDDLYQALKKALTEELVIEDEVDQDISALVKVRDLYASCMNSELIEDRQVQPLVELAKQLGGWPILEPNWNGSNFNWVELVGTLRKYNNDVLITLWVDADGKDSDKYILQLDQTGLGLPSRHYYLTPDMNSRVVKAYKKYMTECLIALGASNETAHNDTEAIFEFEVNLAAILIPPEEQRNLSAAYRRFTIQELQNDVPNLNLTHYLSIVLDKPIDPSERIVTFAARYLKDLGQLVNETEPRTVANYLMWRFMRNRLNNLNQHFQDLKQEFYSVLYGRKQQPERWKFCVNYVNGNMGMALGLLYVREHFNEISKNDTIKLTQEIENVFVDLLKGVEWLDEETKTRAVYKLRNMTLKVGYPSYITNLTALSQEFDQLDIVREEYFENVLKMLQFSAKKEFAKLDRKVDRTQWGTSPAVVNAYYSRNKNQIMLPAGILQPPFYHADFPKAMNYGGIGVVIGHEITHGFDDQGRQYNVNGNLEPWWPEESIANFQNKTKCIIEQYSNFVVEAVDQPINGVNTQGENIADNGGIRQAFLAYKKWQSSAGAGLENEFLPGLNVTADQLFFLNFAQVWCTSLRPEAAVSDLRTSVHAPGRFRVIGSLSNLEAFSTAFQCSVDSKMNPGHRCAVW